MDRGREIIVPDFIQATLLVRKVESAPTQAAQNSSLLFHKYFYVFVVRPMAVKKKLVQSLKMLTLNWSIT